MFRKAIHALRRRLIRGTAATAITLGAVEAATHLPSQGRSSEFYHHISDDLVTPAMRRFLDPEVAHDIALYLTKLGFAPQHHPSAMEQRVNVQTIIFGDKTVSNPIGLAAGFDKDGVAVVPLMKLGFGFVEIGTVTPKAQSGNPKPRLFRLPQDHAIINRYAFNSAGAEAVAENLKRARQLDEVHEPAADVAGGDWNDLSGPQKAWHGLHRVWKFGSSNLQWIYTVLYPQPIDPLQNRLIGVNVGKNKSSVDPADIMADYVYNIIQLGPYADYIVINVSSPNTSGLRDWQHGKFLVELVQACLQARDKVIIDHNVQTSLPLLLKLAPDLDDDELKEIAKIALEQSLDGLVVSNTTMKRPSDLISMHRHEVGGLSGKPIADKSTHCIRVLYAATDGKIPIIGVGGVATGRDALEKLKAGASLVQVYSRMVYQGPGMVSKIRHELAQLLLEQGIRNIEDAVGLDHEELSWRNQQDKAKLQRELENAVVLDEL